MGCHNVAFPDKNSHTSVGQKEFVYIFKQRFV